MKKLRSILLVMCCMMWCTTQAQHNVFGVYLNAEDFNKKKLSYTPAEYQKHSIRLHDIFYKPYITIITTDTTVTYLKDSIFGYSTGDNISYRFFKKDSYLVLNQGLSPLIYKHTIMPGGKSIPQPVVTYYFSKDATSPLLLLTKANIKGAFADDPAFTEQVDDHFNSDEDLIAYDNYCKAYKLNRIYQDLHSSTH